jgi:hypothetical protein
MSWLGVHFNLAIFYSGWSRCCYWCGSSVLVGKGKPRAGDAEKSNFALAITGLSGNLQARRCVHFIHFLLAIARHWTTPRHIAHGRREQINASVQVGRYRAEAS